MSTFSALGKKYGWGVHFNDQGKAAIYSKESDAYDEFINNLSDDLKLLKALRNKRASK